VINTKYKDIVELAKELKRQEQTRVDVVVPTEQLKMETTLADADVMMSVPVQQEDETFEDRLFGITEFAHGQIADKTGIPRKYYEKLRESEKNKLLAENVNSWLPEKDKRLVRILDGNVRALLSDRYRVIDNYDIQTLAIEEFLKIRNSGMNLDIQRLDLTETHMYIKALSKDLVDEIIDKPKNRTDPVGGGIIIRNSEVGAGAFRVEPFMLVYRCTNGLIGEDRFVKVHLGRERGIGIIDWSDDTLRLEDEALWSKITDMIHATFDPKIFHAWVDKLNGVAQVEIEKPKIAVDNIVKRYRFSKQQHEDLLNQFMKESPTQYGMSMAVTRLAQLEGKEDYDAQIKMEEIGNDIIGLKPEVLTVETE